jgi:hypothetical protein
MGWRDSYQGVRAATVAMQWFCQHVSTVEAMFSVWSVRRLYNDSYRQNRFQFLSDSGRVLSSEFSVEDSHGKFVVRRLGVRLEDFIHM